jgi:hypothetical protein
LNVIVPWMRTNSPLRVVGAKVHRRAAWTDTSRSSSGPEIARADSTIPSVETITSTTTDPWT